MDTVLASVSAVPFDFTVQIRNCKRICDTNAAIALDTSNDLVGRAVEIGAFAMTLELEFLAVLSNSQHDGLRGFLSRRQRRGGENATHDHTRVHMPGL